jgi:hypothetical protein
MAQFPSTRYSVVSAIRSDQPEERRLAFDALIAAYWKPVFKYVRLKWHASPDEAADLTQAFFLRAFEKAFFAAFDPARARFRTFLRTCVDGFVANARKADARLKRGGGVTMVPIDIAEAERELQDQSANAVDDFDAYFHREWLRALFAAAAARLRAECLAHDRPIRYELFERYDLAADDDDRPTYAALAQAFGRSPADVTNELAAARRAFRRLVLELLRDLCTSDQEFEAESRALTR